MAIKKESLQKIAAIAKVKFEDLETAIKDEKEVDLTIPDLSTFTDDELKTLNANKYNEGKKAGVEMGVDEVKKELSLDFQGKTIKGLIEAANKKAIADAKIEPDKLNETITKLQNTVKEYETKLAEKDVEVEQIRTTHEVYTDIPDFGENAPALTKKEVVDLMKVNGYEFKKDGAYKDGKRINDKLENAVARKDVIGAFLKDKKLLTEEPTVPGGRGGGNAKPPAVYGKLSEIKAKFTAENKSLNGEEFMAAVEKAQAENKEFDIKS